MTPVRAASEASQLRQIEIKAVKREDISNHFIEPAIAKMALWIERVLNLAERFDLLIETIVVGTRELIVLSPMATTAKQFRDQWRDEVAELIKPIAIRGAVVANEADRIPVFIGRGMIAWGPGTEHRFVGQHAAVTDRVVMKVLSCERFEMILFAQRNLAATRFDRI